MSKDRLIPPALWEMIHQWCREHRMGQIVLNVRDHQIVSGKNIESWCLAGKGNERTLDTFLDNETGK